MAFTALVFAAGTWYWSDVPWSHFFAALLAVGFYALRFGPARSSTLSFSLAGAVLALLALTRSFEFMAVVAAWLLAVGVLFALRVRTPQRPSARKLAFGAGSFVLVLAAVYAVTGKRNSFSSTSREAARTTATCSPAEVAAIPSLDLANLPLKVVQLFLDPVLLLALQPHTSTRGYGQRLGRQPLSIQLPALLAHTALRGGRGAARRARRRDAAIASALHRASFSSSAR